MKMHDSYSKSLWLYGGGISVLAFYAYVFFLMLHPQVSDHYRAYFIDDTTDCWAPNPPPKLSAGGQLPFGDGRLGHNCQILEYGWDLSLTKWGVFSSLPVSSLQLHLDSDAHHEVHLRFHTLGFSPLGTQTISVYVDGIYQTQWRGKHQKITQHDLVVPILETGKPTNVVFVFSEALALSWLNLDTSTQDERKLGMALLGIDWIEP